MKLLTDVRALQGRPDGIGRYSLGVLRGLASIRPDWRLQALVHPAAVSLLEGLPVETVSCGAPRFSRSEPRVLVPLVESSGADAYLNFSMAGPCPAIPTMITVHDLMVLNLPRYFGPDPFRNLAARLIFRSRIRRSVSHAASISVPSRTSLAELAATFPGAEGKAFVTGEGQDLFPVGSGDGLEPRPEGGFLLYVGNARAYKNTTRLLVAYSRMRAFDPDFPPMTMVVRSDRAFAGFLREADDCTGRSGITILSDIDDGKLKELYTGCAGLVVPSLHEGFGLPVLEAMAAGAPVVCSSGTALAELAGDACILVDPRSVTDIMRGMALLVTQPDLRTELSRMGRIRAQSFTWEAAAGQIAKGLEGVL
jgi:glycosyltransferase involved in cell wall biosynthesis